MWFYSEEDLEMQLLYLYLSQGIIVPELCNYLKQDQVTA